MTLSESTPSTSETTLRSGRVVLLDHLDERLEIRAPDGRVELRVTLTDAGPILHFQGAALDLDATDTVAVRCREFRVETREDFRVHAGRDLELDGDGELRSKVAGSTWIDADYVQLNCRDRAGYHDAV